MTAVRPEGECAAVVRHIDLSESAEDQCALLVLAGEHFGVAPAAVEAPEVSWYVDDSSVLASYGCPPMHRASLEQGRASRIDLTLSRTTGHVVRDLDVVRTEYDHPAVKVVPVSAPGWTLAYTVLAGIGAGAAGSTMMRFVQVAAAGSLTVSLDAGAGPLDHGEALRLADGVRQAVRFERRAGQEPPGRDGAAVRGL